MARLGPPHLRRALLGSAPGFEPKRGAHAHAVRASRVRSIAGAASMRVPVLLNALCGLCTAASSDEVPVARRRAGRSVIRWLAGTGPREDAHSRLSPVARPASRASTQAADRSGDDRNLGWPALAWRALLRQCGRPMPLRWPASERNGATAHLRSGAATRCFDDCRHPDPGGSQTRRFENARISSRGRSGSWDCPNAIRRLGWC